MFDNRAWLSILQTGSFYQISLDKSINKCKKIESIKSEFDRKYLEKIAGRKVIADWCPTLEQTRTNGDLSLKTHSEGNGIKSSMYKAPG